MHLRLTQLLLGLAVVAIIATAIVYTTQRLGSNPASDSNRATVTNSGANSNAATNANTAADINSPELTPEEDAGVTANTNAAANVNAAADATRDWRTYLNTGHHYSFQYPPTLLIESDVLGQTAEDADKMNAHLPIPPGNTDQKASQPEFGVEIWSTTKGIQQYAESIRAQNPKASVLYQTVINGQTAYWFTATERYKGNNGSRSLDSEFAFYFVTLEEGKSAAIIWYATEYSQGSTMLATFQFTDQTVATEDSKLLDEDRLVRVRYPKSYTLEKSTERNRRGSFAAYNIIPQGTAPYLNELQLFSLESITQFIEACQKRSDPCFFGDYPTVERFQGMQKAFTAGTSYQGYSLNTLGSEKYLIKNIEAQGEGGLFREYNSFVGTTMVTIWVYMRDASGNAQADTLVTPWSLEYSGY